LQQQAADHRRQGGQVEVCVENSISRERPAGGQPVQIQCGRQVGRTRPASTCPPRRGGGGRCCHVHGEKG
jgi:hypothetical protein